MNRLGFYVKEEVEKPGSKLHTVIDGPASSVVGYDLSEFWGRHPARVQ